MTGTVEVLILDLLEFVAAKERTYEEVMEVWRTSCPRLPVWEDAVDRGLLVTERARNGAWVRITGQGRALLQEERAAKAGSHPANHL